MNTKFNEEEKKEMFQGVLFLVVLLAAVILTFTKITWLDAGIGANIGVFLVTFAMYILACGLVILGSLFILAIVILCFCKVLLGAYNIANGIYSFAKRIRRKQQLV